MSADSQRRLVVVTGAGSGIGRAVALALAARGDRVVAADLDEAAQVDALRDRTHTDQFLNATPEFAAKVVGIIDELRVPGPDGYAAVSRAAREAERSTGQRDPVSPAGPAREGRRAVHRRTLDQRQRRPNDGR